MSPDMTLLEAAKTQPDITLHEAVIQRHSSRLFTSVPVPQDKLERALSLAAHSPSNSNVQPWRLWVLSGTARGRLSTALTAAASRGEEPHIPPLPKQFAPLRSELGREVYGVGWNIAWDDVAARRAAVLRNYDFFGAPTVAIVCMHHELSNADALSVGMYLQTFNLALMQEGVDSCIQVSVAGYPDIIRQVAGIPRDMDVLCAMAVGFEDKEAKVNNIKVGRLGVEETTVILKDQG